jgi:[ribosomal protein S5]-alanine N-acetyltransferase
MQISLLSCDLAMLDLAVEHPQHIEQQLGAPIAREWDDFAPAMQVSRDKLRANPSLSGWWTHLVLAGEPPSVVGMCGYTGPPTADGIVEIAYGTAPSHRGQGIATLAAAKLTERAFCDERVRLVIAHTLMEHNASTRILQKLGMKFAGLDTDVDEGSVWRWELPRSDFKLRASLD